MEETYLKMGKWLNKYGDSLYGTRGGPFKPGPWGVSTHKGNTIYLHVLYSFPENQKKTFSLPLPENISVTDCKSMTGGTVLYRIKDNSISFELKGKLNDINNIIVLTTGKSISDVKPFNTVPQKAAIQGGKAIASSFLNKRFVPENAVLSKKGGFEAGIVHKASWVPKTSNPGEWIGIEYEKPVTFDIITLSEDVRHCKSINFELQYYKNKWVTLYKGIYPGVDFALKTTPITTDKVRFVFSDHLKNSQTRVSGIRLYNSKAFIFQKNVTFTDLDKKSFPSLSSKEKVYYVRLEGNPETVINISEIELFYKKKSLLKNAKVFSSSKGFGTIPERIIDNNKSGLWKDKSIYASEENDPDPWIEIQLSEPSKVDTVTIYNRTDCCMDRIDNSYLLFLDKNKDIIGGKKITGGENTYRLLEEH
jgi:hypothetical protein